MSLRTIAISLLSIVLATSCSSEGWPSGHVCDQDLPITFSGMLGLGIPPEEGDELADYTPLLGAACTALSLGARGGGMLLALIALPLFVPVLVFGAGAAEAQASGLSPGPHLSILGATLILAVMALPFAVSLAVRIALD